MRRAHRQRPRELPAASLLRLIWLASPALPVGGFSYSEGLESAIENTGLACEAAVADWLLDQLHLTQARSDMAVLAKALGAWRRGDAATVRALDDWVLHTRETSEQRLQTEQMGRSLCEWLRNQNRQHQASAEGPTAEPDPPVAHDTVPASARMQQAQPVARAAAEPALPDRSRHPLEGQGYFTYPVAFAQAAAATQAPARQVLLAYAFGWAENMVQAALKSMPLGQSAGQRILARLADAIPAAAGQAIALMDSERQAFAPMLAILSARHETQYSRLFRS
ncbi:urease accessory protein UreF [Verminephrobacter eiseniae]|nr:urease accessory protein UreF [Verminephrobacter eiseniae]